MRFPTDLSFTAFPICDNKEAGTNRRVGPNSVFLALQTNGGSRKFGLINWLNYRTTLSHLIFALSFIVSSVKAQLDKGSYHATPRDRIGLISYKLNAKW